MIVTTALIHRLAKMGAKEQKQLFDDNPDANYAFMIMRCKALVDDPTTKNAEAIDDLRFLANLYLLKQQKPVAVVEINDVKPVLRPLSDMTGEEAEEFALKCMNCRHAPEHFPPVEADEIQTELVHNDGGNSLDSDVEVYIGVSVRCFEGAIVIMKDGRMGIIEEGSPSSTMKPLEEIADKIRHLLSKGFDLFNLIKDGLAIDKSKNTLLCSNP